MNNEKQFEFQISILILKRSDILQETKNKHNLLEFHGSFFQMHIHNSATG